MYNISTAPDETNMSSILSLTLCLIGMKTRFKNRTYNPEIRRATANQKVLRSKPRQSRSSSNPKKKTSSRIPTWPSHTHSLSLSKQNCTIWQTNKQNKNQIHPPSSEPISSPSVSLRSPEIFSFHLLTLEKKNLKLHKEKRKTTHTFNHQHQHPGPHFFWSKIAISPLLCSPFFMLAVKAQHQTDRNRNDESNNSQKSQIERSLQQKCAKTRASSSSSSSSLRCDERFRLPRGGKLPREFTILPHLRHRSVNDQ